MVRYFYEWTAVVAVVGAVILVSNVFLALIALTLVLAAAVAALVWAIVALSDWVGRAVNVTWARSEPRT